MYSAQTPSEDMSTDGARVPAAREKYTWEWPLLIGRFGYSEMLQMIFFHKLLNLLLSNSGR